MPTRDGCDGRTVDAVLARDMSAEDVAELGKLLAITRSRANAAYLASFVPRALHNAYEASELSAEDDAELVQMIVSAQRSRSVGALTPMLAGRRLPVLNVDALDAHNLADVASRPSTFGLMHIAAARSNAAEARGKKPALAAMSEPDVEMLDVDAMDISEPPPPPKPVPANLLAAATKKAEEERKVPSLKKLNELFARQELPPVPAEEYPAFAQWAEVRDRALDDESFCDWRASAEYALTVQYRAMRAAGAADGDDPAVRAHLATLVHEAVDIGALKPRKAAKR